MNFYANSFANIKSFSVFFIFPIFYQNKMLCESKIYKAS